MNESFVLIMLGISGVVFHCLLKMKSLNSYATSANLKFNWWEGYVKKDAFAIILSFLSVFIWYFTFGEIGKRYPGMLDFKRITFVLMGITGSYLIQVASDTFTNSAKKAIQKFVDVKTNISDIVTGPTKTVEEVIKKGDKA